jgi:hypothetical protein
MNVDEVFYTAARKAFDIQEESDRHTEMQS